MLAPIYPAFCFDLYRKREFLLAIVLRDWDPYETIQQSCTPYGFRCHYVLNAARREKAHRTSLLRPATANNSPIPGANPSIYPAFTKSAPSVRSKFSFGLQLPRQRHDQPIVTTRDKVRIRS